ncbi:MAG: papain-like cysteine peptidase [Candidatus Gastranaerophilales bacterium]|nr:papain-like cysteine peptidase [Candidatus Gastranaerophilales bacterium]
MSISQITEKFLIYIKNICKISPYSIVSLGPNCYPKTVLTRTGLIKRKRQGRPTMPFDLAWYHKAEYITEFLKTDFDKFLVDLKYSEFSGSWDNGTKINFSHEAYIGPTEKHRLIQVYRQRINNFRIEMKSDKPVLFLQIFKDAKVGQDCAETYKALQELCGERKFVYVVIDCIGVLDNVNLPSEIFSKKMPYPIEDTSDLTVFSKEFYESPEGISFEQSIADYISQIIIDEFAMTPIKYL